MPELKVFRAVGSYLLNGGLSLLGQCGSKCLNCAENRGYSVDKLKIVLAVSRVWAYAGIYMAKSFEKVFQLILAMPEESLAIPVKCLSLPTTTRGARINILNAYNGNEPITNKLKVFMRGFCVDGSPATAHDTNGFDFNKYANLLNTSILWCSYVLQRGDEINPQEFFRDIKSMMITKRGNKVFKVNSNSIGKVEEIFMGHISFDDENESISKFENENENDKEDLSALIAELE